MAGIGGYSGDECGQSSAKESGKERAEGFGEILRAKLVVPATMSLVACCSYQQLWSSAVVAESLRLLQDVKERCKEMIALEAPIQTSAIVEPETETTTMSMRSFWDVIHGGTSSPVVALRDGEHQAQEKVSAHLGRNKFSFVAAIIVLLVAIFGGLMITVFQPFGAPH